MTKADQYLLFIIYEILFIPEVAFSALVGPCLDSCLMGSLANTGCVQKANSECILLKSLIIQGPVRFSV